MAEPENAEMSERAGVTLGHIRILIPRRGGKGVKADAT